MSQSSDYAAHSPWPRFSARSFPPWRPVSFGSDSPRLAALRSALPIANFPARSPPTPAASHPPSACHKTVSIVSSFPFSFQTLFMPFHPRLRNAHVFFRKLRAALHNAVQENQNSSCVSKIKNPELVFPLLRPQLSKLASHLRTVRKWQVRSFLFQHLDQRQQLRPMLYWQAQQVFLSRCPAVFLNEEIDPPNHLLYSISYKILSNRLYQALQIPPAIPGRREELQECAPGSFLSGARRRTACPK